MMAVSEPQWGLQNTGVRILWKVSRDKVEVEDARDHGYGELGPCWWIRQ